MTQTPNPYSTTNLSEDIQERMAKRIHELNNMPKGLKGWERLKFRLMATPYYREQYKIEGDALFKRLHGSVLGMKD